MYVIVDECLGTKRVRDILEPRGHTVVGVGTAFPSGAPDASILAFAADKGAVQLTTDNDFKTLGHRAGEQTGRLKRANRIVFVRCDVLKAVQRLEALIDDIEREYELHCRLGQANGDVDYRWPVSSGALARPGPATTAGSTQCRRDISPIDLSVGIPHPDWRSRSST